jgi:hypothetical protein
MTLNQMIAALFSGDGPFTAETLTLKILKLPYMNLMLRSRLPWTTKPSYTKTVDIQFNQQGIVLVDAVPRNGGDGIDVTLAETTIEGFTPPRFPLQATINAESVQDRLVALSGGTSDPTALLLAVESVLSDLMKVFVGSYQYLWERQAQQALGGKLKNNAGTTLVDLGAKFGASPQKHYGDFSVGTRNLVKDLVAMKDMSMEATGAWGETPSFILWTFGAASDAFISNQYLEKAKFLQQPDYASADKTRNTGRFLVADNVEIVKYRRSINAGGNVLPTDIDLDEGRGVAILTPVLQDFYHMNVTPMTSNAALRGPGQEIYSYVDPYKQTMNSTHLAAESNVAHTIARPDGIVWMKIDNTNE